MNILDLFNGDLTRALTASEIALRSTQFGRGGVVRAEADTQNNKILFRLMNTGRTFESIEDAFVEASSMAITQFERIVPDAGRIGTAVNNPRRAQMGAILQSLQDEYSHKMSGVNQKFEDFVKQRLGATSADELSFEIVSTQAQRGTQATRFLEMAKKELGGYIPFVSDEGIDLLQLSLGGKKLSSVDTHLLLGYLGNNVLGDAEVMKVFGQGKTPESIEKYLAKIPKRMRSFMSDRDITIGLQDILEIMGGVNKYGKPFAGRKYKAPGQKIMTDEMFLVIEEGLDVFRKYAPGVRARDELVYKAMRNVDAAGVIESVFELQQDRLGMTAAETSAYKTRINDIIKSKEFKKILNSSKSNKKLEELIGNSTFGNEFQEFFSLVMQTSEREFDGLGVLNKKLLDRSKK